MVPKSLQATACKAVACFSMVTCEVVLGFMVSSKVTDRQPDFE